MSIALNSREYDSWHEVGHAVVCLELGGAVHFVEHIGDINHPARARANCKTTVIISPSVGCGGFAAEYLIYQRGLLASSVTSDDFLQATRENSQHDREEFFGRSALSERDLAYFEDFAKREAVPIVEKYFDKMHTVVNALVRDGRVTGEQIVQMLVMSYNCTIKEQEDALEGVLFGNKENLISKVCSSVVKFFKG